MGDGYWSLITIVPAIKSPNRRFPLVINEKTGQQKQKFLRQEFERVIGFPSEKFTTRRPNSPLPKLRPCLILSFQKK
jgi:hypothetical protein